MTRESITATDAAAIEAELIRLRVACTHRHPELLHVYTDADLPAGWVRLSDSTCSIYADSQEVLAALRGVPATEDTQENFDSTWEALGGFSENPPKNSNDWPKDLIFIERLEEGTANDNPLSLLRIETNGGARWVQGPHGVSYCALGDWFDAGLGLIESEEEARAQAAADLARDQNHWPVNR